MLSTGPAIGPVLVVSVLPGGRPLFSVSLVGPDLPWVLGKGLGSKMMSVDWKDNGMEGSASRYYARPPGTRFGMDLLQPARGGVEAFIDVLLEWVVHQAHIGVRVR